MTAKEAAVFLRVERNTVYDYANRGQIPHTKLGRRMLFSTLPESLLKNIPC